MKTDIKSLTLAELQSQLAQMGQSSFRAGQVYAWLHRGAVTFGEMTDLPKALRESLDDTRSLRPRSFANRLPSRTVR